MGGITDFLFGSHPTQQGTAQSPGQAWLQQQMKPGLGQVFSNLFNNQPAYNVPQAPMAPSAPNIPDYNAGSYSVPTAPFNSPTDLIQSGELRTAQNLMQNFYSGGGGGSAMGGLSGQGASVMGNVLSDLSQGAVGRFAQMQLPYDQMQANQAQDIWGLQNQANMQQWQQNALLPLQQQNLGYTSGQIPQWQAQTQAMNPYPYYSMYSGTYGTPMVQPGQQGLVQSVAPFAALGGLNMAIPGLFSGLF